MSMPLYRRYLATSFSLAVADGFISRSAMPAKIRWLVRIDPVRRCVHVNLVRMHVECIGSPKSYAEVR